MALSLNAHSSVAPVGCVAPPVAAARSSATPSAWTLLSTATAPAILSCMAHAGKHCDRSRGIDCYRGCEHGQSCCLLQNARVGQRRAIHCHGGCDHGQRHCLLQNAGIRYCRPSNICYCVVNECCHFPESHVVSENDCWTADF